MKSWTAGVLRTPKRIAVTVTICIAIAVLPLLVFLGYSLVQSHELQSRQLLQQRLFATRLAAGTVAAELNSIRVFGNWYSRSPDIRALVSGKRWQALSKDMDRLVEQLPSLVRLFASDERGRLWADSPRKPDVHGVDFSYRDWFRGALENRGPYLSHAYRRTAAPRILVASMAFPVHDRQGKISGVIVFQLGLQTIWSWTAKAPLRDGVRLKFIDQHERGFSVNDGNVVLDTAPVDWPAPAPGAASAVVQDDERAVTAYARVPGWNWDIFITESAEDFYSSRNSNLSAVVIVVGLVLMLCAASIGTTFALLRLLVNKEQALRRTNADLVSANRNLRELTHAVSHDLRAPLRAMGGFAEALAEDHNDKLDDQGRHHLGRIKAGSDKLSRMVEDLLAVARIPQAELSVGEVDLSRLAHDIIADLQATEPDRQVEVRIEPGLKTRGDSTLLGLVLRNLLQNAWKFTRGVERAEIRLGREPGGEPVYYVRDNGAGFDPEYADKLFTMFQRLHSGSEFEGSGIGLAAALQAIERHGGHIWAESREGEGAVFRFTIPQAP